MLRLLKLRVTLLGMLFAGAAHAATVERVTLATGFQMDCVHREAIDANRVRLYTSEQNFVEVASASIRNVERVEVVLPVASAITPIVAAPQPVSLHGLMQSAGAKHNIDVELLASVVRAESGGNHKAVSRTGAQGLMQLMPGTARQLGVTDSFAPEQNINGGTTYLDQLLVRYHDDVTLALAAYNAGPGAVDRYHGVPPYRETRAYVARVINEFNRRKRAKARTQAAAE